MRTESITVTEASRHFSNYLNRVAYRNEVFILRRGPSPVAELRPVPRGRCLGDLPGIIQSLPMMSKAMARTFAADVVKARDKSAKEGLRDPWAS